MSDIAKDIASMIDQKPADEQSSKAPDTLGKDPGTRAGKPIHEYSPQWKEYLEKRGKKPA